MPTRQEIEQAISYADQSGNAAMADRLRARLSAMDAPAAQNTSQAQPSPQPQRPQRWQDDILAGLGQIGIGAAGMFDLPQIAFDRAASVGQLGTAALMKAAGQGPAEYGELVRKGRENLKTRGNLTELVERGVEKVAPGAMDERQIEHPYIAAMERAVGSALTQPQSVIAQGLKGVASVATGALGGEAARQAGGGPFSQLMASLASGGAPYLRSPIKGVASEDMKGLVEKGVMPTIGSVAASTDTKLGHTLHRMEDSAARIPITGAVITERGKDATKSLNRVAVNRALSAVGEELPSSIREGNRAFDYANRKLSDAYDALLPKMTLVADDEFGVAMQDISSMVNKLTPDLQKAVRARIGDKVMSRFQNGQMDGETAKKVGSYLTSEASKFARSSNVMERDAADVFQALDLAIKDNIARSNPAHLEELTRLNKGWADLVVLGHATNQAAKRGGVFSPSDLMTGVQKSDTSLRQMRTARGKANMQDIASPASELMPSELAGGDNIERGIGVGLLLAPGKILGNPMSAAQGVATSALYSKPVHDRIVRHMTAQTRNPSIEEQVRQYISGTAVPVGGQAVTDQEKKRLMLIEQLKRNKEY